MTESQITTLGVQDMVSHQQEMKNNHGYRLVVTEHDGSKWVDFDEAVSSRLELEKIKDKIFVSVELLSQTETTLLILLRQYQGNQYTLIANCIDNLRSVKAALTPPARVEDSEQP